MSLAGKGLSLSLLVLVAGCQAAPETEVVVEVSARYCVATSPLDQCPTVRIAADVLIEGANDVRVSGTAGPSGLVRLTLPRGGDYSVVASAPLIRSGSHETRFAAADKASTTVAVVAELAESHELKECREGRAA